MINGIFIERFIVNAHLHAAGIPAELAEFASAPFAGESKPNDAAPAPAQRPPAIGTRWDEQGGIYAGVMRGANGCDYHVILGDAVADTITFGEPGNNIHDATSDMDGLANTAALCECAVDHPAAQWARNLDQGGHTDWYLPARRELRLLWCTVADAFSPGWYWSSTQGSAYTAWTQGFDDGSQDFDDKDYQGRARAVRRFLAT